MGPSIVRRLRRSWHPRLAGGACRLVRVIGVLGALGLILVGCLAPLSRPSPPEAMTSPVSSTARDHVPAFSHVFVIVMENKEYGDVIGSPAAPYLNRLATAHGSADRYYAIRHPSLPNYLALISGSTQGMTTDCAVCSFAAPNLVDQLEQHGHSWTAYVEDLPRPCFSGPFAGSLVDWLRGSVYVRRHNPFMYFDDVRDDARRCGQVVPLSHFSADLAAQHLPDFVWISPNLKHDMHSGSVRAGDDWLAAFVPPILETSAWRENGVLFITWDEGKSDQGCCGNAAGGHVPTLVVAAAGRPGFHSPLPYTHYSLLRTVEDAWGLELLGHSADSTTTPMADFFS
jgi:hypothetical protein